MGQVRHGSATTTHAVRAAIQRLKERGKPHKLVIIAIARRLIVIANAIIKTGAPWQSQPGK